MNKVTLAVLCGFLAVVCSQPVHAAGGNDKQAVATFSTSDATSAYHASDVRTPMARFRKSAVYPFGSGEPPSDTTLEFDTYSRDDSFAETFSLEQGAGFVDGVAVKWGKKHGCVTCHTNGYYLIGPGSLFRDRPAHLEVRQFAEDFVNSWQRFGVPDTEIVVATASFLAINDAQMGDELRPATLLALDSAWSEQSIEGHWPDWVKCNWPPFEQDDHYGVTLMAIAMGMAPSSYTKTEPALSGISRLHDYLGNHPPVEIHHKAMLLWAARYDRDLISGEQRRQWIQELSTLQRPDGGWASGDLGEWRQIRGLSTDPPVNVETDGYGTGFVTYVLLQAGVEASDERIQRGITWLKTNQRRDGKWWTQSLRNESDTSNFLTHTGTVFALKALVASEMDPEVIAAGSGE